MHTTIRRNYAVAMVALVFAAPAATQQQNQNDSSPLVLPGHRYDLPATLITAAQIDAHKKT